ncbi:hypothetical protein HDU79_008103 [Rhizoclosmatium sp. JEL0117]|nr:hypothetical protein HDU79_008103 [Rhizoclosmatium sp. JEL0117]
MSVEIPASLYALLQQQALASQQQQKPIISTSVAAAQPAPLNPTLLTSESSKAQYVLRLVDTSASIIESIWPTQIPQGAAKVLPLKFFIQEILRRSKTSCCTLQLALYYIIRLRNQLAKDGQSSVQPELSLLTPPASPSFANESVPVCGRRMFLTALILASKYLQDRNYSNKAWSKISGLTVTEINANEFKFLGLIDYELFVGHETFANWTSLLNTKMQQLQLAQSLHLQQKAATPLLHQTSSLGVACKPCDQQAVFAHHQQLLSLQSLAHAAASAVPLVATKVSAQPPASVSPTLEEFASPVSVDDNVPSGSDCGLKRGRSYCDEEDSFIKRVCL